MQDCLTCAYYGDCPGLGQVCVGYVRANNLNGEINERSEDDA